MLRSRLSWAGVRGWIDRRLVPVLLAIAIAFGLSMGSEVQAATQVDFGSARWQSISGGTGCDTGFVCTAEQACLSAKASWLAGYTTLQRIDLETNPRYPYKASAVCVAVKADGSGAYGMTAIGSDTVYVAGPPPPSCTAVGATVNGENYTIVSPTQLAYGLNFCLPQSGTSGGCAVSAVSRTGTVNLSTGQWEYKYWGPFKTVGQACSGNGTGATTPVQDQPQKCDSKAGMCTGTVNGVESCVKCAQTDSATAKTQTTSNPDGSTTQTSTSSSVTFNDNSVTTNTTTTTTTTPAGGGTPTTQTKTDSATQSKDSYCQANPNDGNCKDVKGQVSGGDTCDAPPTCAGDAIQCAMVQQQFKTRCELQKTDDSSTFGSQLANGQDPDAAKLPTPGNASVLDMSSKYAGLDNMGVTPQCLPDVQVNMPGVMWLPAASLTISTGPLCDHGKLLGMLNIMATAIVCAYMLKGSF